MTLLTSKKHLMNKNPSSKQDKSIEPAIFADSLVKTYKGAPKPALNNFCLKVPRSAFYGLLGPNGAGKTTAISILTGLLSADSGKVTILGHHLKHHKKAIQERIGFVPQDIAIFEKLTGYENLKFFARLFGLSGSHMHEQIEQCLHFTQLTNNSSRLVSTYSGGMKRRLNLAAAMLHNPDILFLDEPTVGIDAQSRQLIHERLASLNKKGTTIIYTTHYMEEAQELCSHVAIIDNGHIIQEGPTEQLTKSQGFTNLNELFFSITGKQLRDV